MEKDGWLDQLLLGLLRFLTTPLLGLSVAFFGAMLVGYLARRSPKDDWEFINDWPDKLLGGAFLFMAGLRSVPRLVYPKWTFTCDHINDELGLPRTTNCRFLSDGAVRTVIDYSFLDMVRDFFVDALGNLIVGGIGLLIGRALAGHRPATAAES